MTAAVAAGSPFWRRWLPWSGAVIGLVALAFVLQGFDLVRFRAVVENVDKRLILLVPLAITAEQLVRAWKWRANLRGGVMVGFSAHACMAALEIWDSQTRVCPRAEWQCSSSLPGTRTNANTEAWMFRSPSCEPILLQYQSGGVDSAEDGTQARPKSAPRQR